MSTKIYKKLATAPVGAYTLHGTFADGVTTDMAGGLTEATDYAFKAVRVDANGTESTPLYANARTLSNSSDLIGVTNSNTSQTIIWSNMVGAEGYELERSTNSDYSGSTLLYSGTNTYYHDNGQTPGTIYYYRVRKLPSGGWITYSRPAPWIYEMFKGIDGATVDASWTRLNGTWVYEADQLKVNSTTSEAYMTKELGGSDFVMYTYLKPNETGANGGGVVFRFIDANNHWMARYNQSTNALELYERVAGTYVLRATSTQAEFTTLEPYELKITCVGAAISVTLQHYNKTVSYTSAVHQTATRVGIRATQIQSGGLNVGYIVAYPIEVAETQFKLYGVLEYFQEPVAIRFTGKFDRTYEAYISRWGQVVTRWFDHNAQVYSTLYVVDSLMAEHGVEAMDDHNPPALHVLPNGKILIWYTVHDVNDIFYQKITLEAENITTYGSRQNMVDTAPSQPYNYPQPVELGNGTLALFYRRGTYDNNKWVYKKSTNSGLNWGAPVVLFDNTPSGVYAYVAQNPANKNEIHMAGYFSYTTSPWRKDIWYAKCANLLTTDTWAKSNGTPYVLPLTDTTAELVLDTGTLNNLVTDIKVINNKPYITYGYDKNPNHRLKWCELSGGVWVHREVAHSRQFYGSNAAHQYTPGIILNPANPYEVVLFVDRLSNKANVGRLELEVWESTNNGVTWAQKEIITSNSRFDNYRVQWVVNAAPDHRFLWCGAGLFTGIDGGNWWGYNNVRVQSEKDKITQ